MTTDDLVNESNLPNIKWWGEFHFKPYQTRAWRFGSLLLRITRGIQEWRMEYHRPDVQFDDEQNWEEILEPDFAFPQTIHVERYMFRKMGNTFTLMPRLANRSVVIRPVDPMYIPAGQRGLLYISTPLWIAGFAEDQKEPLFDIPILRPKDTWFGPDKRTGELCYATAVDGRTELEQLQPRAFRAVTPIIFHNSSHELLRFDRMNIPVPALPLFYSESTHRLWTSHIKVVHESPDRSPRVRIENRTPPRAGEVTYMHAPRYPESALFHMFDSFF